MGNTKLVKFAKKRDVLNDKQEYHPVEILVLYISPSAHLLLISVFGLMTQPVSNTLGFSPEKLENRNHELKAEGIRFLK